MCFSEYGGWLADFRCDTEVAEDRWAGDDRQDSARDNLNVAEALFRMTYLENWGSGAKRIIDACRAQNVEDPTWSDNGGFITVTFKRPNYASNPNENLEDNVAPNKSGVVLNVAQSTDNVAPNEEDVAQSLDDRILQIIKSNPTIKREDIATQLSVNKKTIERHLKYLGIKWDGHSKTGHWHI